MTISYDLSIDQTTAEPAPFTTTTTTKPLGSYNAEDDFQLSESRSVIKVHTAREQLAHLDERPEALENASEKPDFVAVTAATSTEATEWTTFSYSLVQPTTDNLDFERSPKRIQSKNPVAQNVENKADLNRLKSSAKETAESITSLEEGNYHEINPGQYHEVNPGQYHEVNPGQYHETNPGQYHEINPGQYEEQHPGQDLGVDKITVNFDQEEEDQSRTYNVKANAGDFIIGEVGRIDINSGQTIHGVRYTAVDGVVDQARISDILEQYFGARAS